MAISFKNTKGKAIKNSVDAYEYKDGDNEVRIFGDVLPRYVYWLKGSNGKDIPIECLSFDRDLEKFTNTERDYVREYYPDLKCSWAYSVNCIDPKDGKAKVLNLKKKLFNDVLSAAEDLGDPTDLNTGWALAFRKIKTGPLAFNVEYQLRPLACKPKALTEDEKAVVAAAKPIDQAYPRPTPDEVKALLERIRSGGEATTEDEAAKEAVNELG